MIKPRRIGHATFETPDLEKAIAYYEKFMGLIVAEREKDRAFLASKVGPLVIQLNKADRAHCIKLSFEVAPDSDFGELARELAQGRRAQRAAQRFHSRHRPGAVVPGQQRHHHRAVQGMELSRQARAGRRHRPAQARACGFLYARTSNDGGVLREGAGLSRFRLDRRLLLLHALQSRSSHRELLHRPERQAPSHRLRAQGFHAPAEFVRAHGAEAGADHLGSAAARPRPQHRHLSSQSGRAGGRVLLRARQDDGRGARLFRAAPLAPRHAAAAQAVDARQDHVWGPTPEDDFHRTQV